MKKLVIVESPTKAKTISKFLDKNYKIMSSYGHLRDLPKKDLGVDVEHNFKPKYVVADDKKAVIDELYKAAQKSNMVYFATDEDREGEAISWHLLYLLSQKQKDIQHKRIVFHEITKDAILEALKSPREIDKNLVDAQQARRILDRLVGYKLSPFLWKKVSKGLSAGRVQSVAVRLIVEREREIQKFKPEEYWDIEATLENQHKQEFNAKLIKIVDKKLEKFDLKNQRQVNGIVEDLEKQNYQVSKIETKQTPKKPQPPFTTSSLQQEAHNKLGFSSKQTMYLAQNLYEGIKLGKEQVGLITYMRTDSLNLSSNFTTQAHSYIQDEFGHKYLPKQVNKYSTKSKTAQEAHEAIRPTDLSRAPEEIKNYLNDKQYKLYDLIWKRALASQMQAAKINKTSIDIAAGKYLLRANGSQISFDGWLKVYPGITKENILPQIKQAEKFGLKELKPTQHFTEPPPRYNDASLVKKLEELGIGRPSTYAPIISTIQQRNYIKRESAKFIPQDISFVVVDLLKDHFPKIVDYKFTANMEDDLDKIAGGKKKWQPIIKKFYSPFIKNLEQKYEQIKKQDLITEKSSEVCDKCGKPMVVKTSRYGRFLACSGFPKCRNTKQIAKINKENEVNDVEVKEKEEPEKTDLECEKCGSPMVIRHGRFGKFYACSNFPKCKNTKPLDQDTGINCPQCGNGSIVAKKTRSKKTFYACDNYPKCKYALWAKPTGNNCPKCESLMINAGKDKEKCSNQKCKHTQEVEK